MPGLTEIWYIEIGLPRGSAQLVRLCRTQRMIIDAHLHLPSIGERRTYDQAMDLLVSNLREEGVDYAVLIPDNVPGSAIGDVDTCLRLIEGEPGLFLLGTVDTEHQGEEWTAYTDSLLTQRKIVGMKIFPGHDPIYPTDPRLFPYYEMCQAHDAPMVIHTGWNPGHPEVAEYNDPKYIVEIARRYPGLPIVIAHYFWPEVDYCFDLTHNCPNIYYDTSGLAAPEVVKITGGEAIRRVLLKTLNEDPRKVIFGTDYPMCDRQQHMDLINALPVSEEVHEGIFGRNAAQLFGLSDHQLP
jgi:hypothetical protein